MSVAAADVFLSYNRADAEAVHQVQSRLKEAGLTTFLDRHALPAGQEWQPWLETALAGCRALAIFLGPSGLGRWQHREIQLGLDRQATAEKAAPFPVIPVLLPGLQKDDIPLGRFLGLNTWIDLRQGLDEPEALQRLVAGAQGQAIDGVAADHLLAGVCPYRGLLPFREQDAGLFFGRTRFVDELVAKVRQCTAANTVAVVGRSGSGKSSVVYAGLFPALRREKGLGEQAVWDILSLRPLAEPLHQLARAFAPALHNGDPIKARVTLNEHADHFRKRQLTVAELVSDRLQTDKGSTRLLLYVDQWEELYTQAQPREVKTEQDKRRAEDAQLFIDLLLDAAATAPCTLVLSVRSDFYPDIQSHDCLRAAVQDGQVSLGPMSEPELRAVIEGPAKAVGLQVHPDLTTRLVRDIGLDMTAGRNGQYDIRKLPLLEYALKETWRRREDQRLSLNAYGQAGGIDGAVAQRANQIFKSLSQDQQAAARRLFVSLVTPGEGREDTRARAVYPEQDAAIAAVIDKFSDARLLVTGEDAPSARRLVDLSHEAMIREWDLLKTWIETNRETLRRREHIRARQRQWEEQGKDPTLLLSPGLPLEEGRKLLADHGDVLIEEAQPYIAASLAADEERRRQAEAAADAELQRELAAAQELASQTHLANWYAEQAIDITGGFVTKAVELSDRYHVPRSAIEDLLKQADIAFQKLIKKDMTPQLRSAIAWQQIVFADHYGIIGKSERKLDTAKRVRDMLKELVTEHPPNPEWLKQLACSHDLVGNALADQLQLGAALAEYRASRSIREKLWKDNPSDPHFKRDLSISDIKIGDMNFEQGHLEEAFAAFDSARKIINKLACADPANRDMQRDLLMIDHRIGEVLTKQGDLNGAGKSYQTSLDIAEQLAAADQSNIQFQRDLAANHEKIGNNLEDQGEMEAALAAYRTSLSITERLAADDPQKVPIQSDLSLGHENVGRILLKQHRIDAALVALRASLAITEQLAADPANASVQRDLSIKLNNMGDALKEQGDLQAALDHYQRSLAIRKKLAAADPSNTQLQRDVLHGHKLIGDILHEQGQFQEEIGECQAYI